MGLGFGVWVSWALFFIFYYRFRVLGCGFGVWGLGCGVHVLRFGVWGLGFRFEGLWFMVHG